MEFKAGDKIFIRCQELQNLSDEFVKSYTKARHAQFIRINIYLYNLAVVMVNSNGCVLNEHVRTTMCIPYFDDTSKMLSERINLFLEAYHV